MNQQPSDTTTICSRCGKATQSTNGSITQWISGCKCAEWQELSQLHAPQACAACGKSIQAGRPGSLRQWVFRQDMCSCRAGGMGLPVQISTWTEISSSVKLVPLFFHCDPRKSTRTEAGTLKSQIRLPDSLIDEPETTR